MKTSAPKMLGWAILGAAILTPILLCWAGAFQGPVLESHTHSIGPFTATTVIYEVQWPWWLTLVLLGATLCGITLLSTRENRNG